MKAMEEHAMDAFVARVRDHLYRVFPDQCVAMAEPALREWIDAAVSAARGWRLRTELDVVRYIDLAFALGPCFDREPRFSAILASSRSPSARLDALVAEVCNTAGH